MIKLADPAALGVSPDMLKTALSESFEDLLAGSLSLDGNIEKTVVKGIVTAIEHDVAIVDVGMKAEGRVPLREFVSHESGEVELTVGDSVDVFVDNLDDNNGEARLSREKARREEVMDTLETAFKEAEKVSGVIFGKVKGGFMVDVSGVLAFLPGSQMDARPIRDVTPYMYTPQELMILKLDRQKGNLIVSRRAVMDETRGEARDELLEGMAEGKQLEGVVKNITDYGAFIDLGGVDGLLHITDIAWHRINHPSEVLSVGQVVKVLVVRFDEKTKRVSLGMKQMNNDPWTEVDGKYPMGTVVKGRITNITDYGAFVELSPGIEGLIHVSEMSWTRKNVHPGKLVSTSEEVDVMVLEIDHEKRRISLGLKQCQDNPWKVYTEKNKEGTEVEGTVRSVTDFGIFVGLTEEIDGLVHMSDISWEKSGEDALSEYKKGDTVKAVVLSADADKERVSLGIKQLGEDPMKAVSGAFKKGATVTGTVTEADDRGITLDIGGEMPGFVKRADVARDKAEQTPENFKVGTEVSAKVLSVSARDRRVNLTIKGLLMDEEKAAVAEYASSSSGSATLGDALGAALAGAKPAEEKPAKKAAAKKSTKKDAE